MADELKITNPRELEIWLKDKPVEWAQVIAVRTAMRVLPMVHRNYEIDYISDSAKNNLVMQSIRALFISWAVARYPNRKLKKGAVLASNVISNLQSLETTSYAANIAAIHGLNAVVTKNSKKVINSLLKTIDAAGAASASLNVVWDALSLDATAIEDIWYSNNARQQAKSLVEQKLWTDSEPSWVRNGKYFFEFLQPVRNISGVELWEVWYSRRLNAQSAFGFFLIKDDEDFVEKIATQQNEFWEQGLTKVSEDIAGWLKEARKEDRGDVEQETTSIPPQKPASVQPIWVEGRLVQSTASMHAELEDELLAAFAQGLRNEIANLANDVQQTNFDKSGLALLAETADLMPEIKPDAILLFQLVFREAQLSDQIDMIKGQWSETLATRYCTLLRQLSVYLDRFTERRQFDRDKLETDLEDVDLDDLDQEISIFGNYLRSDDVSVIVDVSIPDALESIGVSTPDDNADDLPPIEAGRSTQIVKAADQIESVNNVSRELIDLVGVENAPNIIAAGKAAYVKAIEENYVDASHEAGIEEAKKLSKLVNRGSVGLSAGRSIMNRLGDKFPKLFGWMNRSSD